MSVADWKARLRREALEQIAKQVAEGTLVIRQMTPEERAKYPPKRRSERAGRRLYQGLLPERGDECASDRSAPSTASALAATTGRLRPGYSRTLACAA
jgi:hypothetical protein